MDHRALRYFVQVAESGSFSKAAVLLRIGQPALSRSIKQLERELGVTLFDRLRSGVRLTQSGQLLRRRAQQILDLHHQIHNEIRVQADEISGSATLGIPAAAGQLILPALLKYFSRHHPAIRIRTIEGVSAENYDRLHSQTTQICLLYDPLPHRDLVIQPLAVEDMYLVAREELLEPLRSPCTIKDLENLPMILPSSPNSRRLLVEKAFRERNLILNVAAEVDSFVVTRALLLDGSGYSLTTLSSIADLPGRSALSYIELSRSSMNWMLSIAYHVANSRNPVVPAIARALQVVGRELIDSGRWQGARYASNAATATKFTHHG